MNKDQNEILIFSTPSGKSIFYDLFQDEIKKMEKLKDRHFDDWLSKAKIRDNVSWWKYDQS